MSAEYQRDVSTPAAISPAMTGTAAESDLEKAHRKAEDARRQAAAIGDYVTAERWFNRERVLSVELRARDQQTHP